MVEKTHSHSPDKYSINLAAISNGGNSGAEGTCNDGQRV